MFFPDNEGGTARMIAPSHISYWLLCGGRVFSCREQEHFKVPIIRKIQEENMSKELAKTYDPRVLRIVCTKMDG